MANFDDALGATATVTAPKGKTEDIPRNKCTLLRDRNRTDALPKRFDSQRPARNRIDARRRVVDRIDRVASTIYLLQKD